MKCIIFKTGRSGETKTVISLCKKNNPVQWRSLDPRRIELKSVVKSAAFFLFLMLSPGCLNVNHQGPAAVKGVIDLTANNFSSQKVINLDGEWEFYWKQLLSPEDLKKAPDVRHIRYAPVPSTWHDLSVNGLEAEPKGYATYRLKILVPDKDTMYGIRVFSLMSAYKIWADGMLIGEAGKVGISDETTEHRWIPGEYYFRSSSGVVDIVIQISNFRCDIGGFWTPLNFGYAQSIASMRRMKISFDNFLIGILLMLAFYHIGFYIFQRKEKSSLWFGVFCIIMAVRIVSLGEQRILYQILDPFWDISYRIELLSFYIAGGVFYFFLRSIYPVESSRLIEKWTKIFIMVSIGLVTVLPAFWIGRVINFYIITTIFYIAASIAVLFKALRRKKEYSIFFMAGIIALLISALNDMMNLLGLLHTGFYVHVGFMVFVLAQSFIMLRRFSMSFVNTENLTMELELINKTLEQKVDERTRELENERNALQDQSSIMDEELKMARSIQRGLIPVKAPFDNIAFYYRPMKRVGGDFFDFIKMREDSIGIFISDVSGHGVPAALITSMLKSFVLQSGEKKQNPGQLMAYLNDSLISYTSGNFITAFYCIYNPGERNFVYCNAGHPLPYIISDHGVESISSANRMPPLSVFKSDELEEYNKQYRNSSITLNPGERILFFTDGLIEARAGKFTREMFGDSELEIVLYENRDLPIDEFLILINMRLIDYCRSENLEDDICMICIDV
ncbi:MAG TPA: SpoIIE family protein phosphatase [Spirochaetota bacterium]|nr:SpoIIE family protein phosphatase [Spirochaetota bacterium]